MSEKKYIDVDLLKSELKDLNESERLCYMGVFDIINSQSTADVAEIVRCKDCKYFCEKEGKCYGQDIRAEEGHDCYKNDDDFCSCGEKIKEE